MDLQNILIQSLSTVIVALLGLGVAYLVKFLNAKTIKLKEEAMNIKDDGQRKLVIDAVDRINSLVQTNVIAVEQTLGKDIKNVVADGVIDKDELKGLAQIVVDRVKGQANDDVLLLANQSISDLDAYILATIEKELAKVKEQIK